MRIYVILVFLVLSSATIFGQTENLEWQLRIPTHIQIQGEERTLGLAVWDVLPNVMADKNHTSTLLVGGPLWQNSKGWLEIMGGSRINQDGYIDPLVNLRFLDSHIRKVNSSGDIMLFFREKKRRFLWWFAVDTAIPVWKLRAGVETENTNFFGGQNLWGVGPRVITPLPFKLPSAIKFSLVTAYHFHNRRDFVRVYAVTTIKVR